MANSVRILPLLLLLVFSGCSTMTENKEKPNSIQNAVEVLNDTTPQQPVHPSKPLVKELPGSEKQASASGGNKKKTETTKANNSLYRINIGDELEISVLDEPEMTRNIKVMPDGTITYLLVGEVKAEGKTLAQLRKELTEKLKEFFVAPYVSVITQTINVPPEEEKRISILGALKSPGNYTWHKGDRVLDLIAKAGGLLYTQTELGSRTTANLKASYISRNGKDLPVDFYKLIKLGDMSYNIPLNPNDFVYIADSEEATLIVMGEVYSPRIIPYTRDYSLVEALSICGGFTREAYQSRVVIIRTTPEGETKYVEVDVRDLLHGKDIKNLMLKSGDIVYVPEQPLSEYARWASFFTDIANLVLKGYEVRDAVMFPKLNRHTPSD